MTALNLIPGQLSLAQLRAIYQQPVTLSLDDSATAQIEASVACVEQILAENRTAYGINTGFGLLASTRIASEDLENLQRSLVLSHAAGVGEPISDALVRLVMVLKVNSLSRGFSGIRRQVIDALIALINAEVYPHIPLKGSVGASGDLAPLAHMSLVLLGEGKARYKGEWLEAAEALKVAGLAPLTLAAKEGLALLNGTQVSTAYALRGLFEGEDLFAGALACGGLTVEAVLGSRSPFDARIHAARGQRGQIDSAAAYRDLLGESSQVSQSHQNCDKVQDPYSLRCQPQVMGACLTQFRQAAEVLVVEANAVSDNPLVFAAEGDVISGGNFHAEPVAMSADNMALAIAVDVRREEAVLVVERDFAAQNAARFFQLGRGFQAFAQVQALARGQPFHGEDATGVLGHFPQTLARSRRHGDVVFLVGRGRQAIHAMGVSQRLVLAGECAPA